MRALCVQQPWAGLIADAVKTLEVRSWSTPYRGTVAIVASGRWSRLEAARRHRDAYWREPRGVALCLVELVDIREGTARDVFRTGGVDPTGQYVWTFENPRALERVSVKGFLNLCRPQFHIRLAA